jgi:hypothetical protein
MSSERIRQEAPKYNGMVMPLAHSVVNKQVMKWPRIGSVADSAI